MLKLMAFLKPYKKWIVFMFLFLFTRVLGILYIPALVAGIVNSGIVAGDLNYVREIGVFMLVVTLFIADMSIGNTYTSTYIAAGMGSDTRERLFFKVQSFSVNDPNRFGVVSMITCGTSDVVQIQQAFSVLVQMLLPAPFMAIVGPILAFSKNRLLTSIILGLIMFPVAFSAIAITRVTPMFGHLQALIDKINHTVRGNIIGIRVIRAFNRAGHEKARVGQSFADYAKITIRASKSFTCVFPMVMGVMSLCTLLILWFGRKQVTAGNMQVGDITAIIKYAVLISIHLIMGVAVFTMIPRAQACTQHIDTVLDMEPEISDNVVSGKVVKLEDPVPHGEVEFRNVTSHYEHAKGDVLHGISFSVRKGQTTAIIGGTGFNKSIIASLLMRLYDVQEGNILIKGRDVWEYGQWKLRGMIGYVPQKTLLFSGTIADSLRHGKKDATDLEVHHAIITAQIDDFTREHKRGLDVPVLRGGGNSSGRQKQRLSIARTAIKGPDIFLFSDSFSALDFKTDTKLRKALKREVKENVVIIIVQGISTTTNADWIIVLNEDRIVGKGTHETLMADCFVHQNAVQS